MMKNLRRKHTRIEEIYKIVNENFMNREDSINWFMSPNIQLSNKAPMYFIKNDKINYLLKRIKQMAQDKKLT